MGTAISCPPQIVDIREKNHSQGADKRCSAPQKSVGCRRKTLVKPERPTPHQNCVGRVVRILARFCNDDVRRLFGAERFCRQPERSCSAALAYYNPISVLVQMPKSAFLERSAFPNRLRPIGHTLFQKAPVPFGRRSPLQK